MSSHETRIAILEVKTASIGKNLDRLTWALLGAIGNAMLVSADYVIHKLISG